MSNTAVTAGSNSSNIAVTANFQLVFALVCNSVKEVLPLHLVIYIWAASWQNQQNDCAPSEYWSVWADQSLRCAING